MIGRIIKTAAGTAGTVAALAVIVVTAPATPGQASVTGPAWQSRAIPPRWLSWSGTFRDHGSRCVYVKGGHGPRVGEVCANGKAYAYTVYAPVSSRRPLPPWVMWTPLRHTRAILVWGGNGDTTLTVGPRNHTETS